jgi:hypothetical protein
MLTVAFLLAFTAFVVTIAAALEPPRAKLWVAVLLLAVALLLQSIPIR